MQVEGAREVAVEIFSMSKSYNMAGWRVGFCLGNARMIGALARTSGSGAAHRRASRAGKGYLRGVPADPDCGDHWAAGVRGGGGEDPGGVPEEAGRAGEGRCAEKCLKALLLSGGLDVPKTPDLRVLVQEAPGKVSSLFDLNEVLILNR